MARDSWLVCIHCGSVWSADDDFLFEEVVLDPYNYFRKLRRFLPTPRCTCGRTKFYPFEDRSDAETFTASERI